VGVRGDRVAVAPGGVGGARAGRRRGDTRDRAGLSPLGGLWHELTGLAQLRQGIVASRATGAALFAPFYGTMLADVAAHLGHTADGLQVLAEAYALVEQQEECWWEAEICRLRGVVLLQQLETPQAEAEAWLQRALDVARRQEAKSLELRAAMSLARLWQQHGERAEAYELLAPVYGWFTEGFDTADLQEAKALLEEVGG
jgi:predicted ATPase